MRSQVRKVKNDTEARIASELCQAHPRGKEGGYIGEPNHPLVSWLPQSSFEETFRLDLSKLCDTQWQEPQEGDDGTEEIVARETG